MEEKERFEFGQRTLFDSGEEVTTFDGFNLDDFMQIICSLLNKQSNRIKDLELLLNSDKKIETNSLNGFEKLRQENQQLKQQLTITEKALELACEEIGRIEAKFGSAYIRADGYLLDYFKTNAKELLENE